MFMRRCMEHHVRLIAREQAVHLFGIAHRGDAYIQLERTAVAALQLLLDGIGAVFINIHNDEPLWPAGRDLAAQLRTDGTAAARYQHRFAGKVAGNFVGIQRDLLAGEEVGGVQLAEHLLLGRTAAHQLRVAEHLYRAVGADAQVDNVAQAAAL